MSETATFDDYKRRLHGDDPDLWQLHGEWWHVTETRQPAALRQRPERQLVQAIDLSGGSCAIAPWSLPE
jgi:hypothetical protein